MPGRPRRRAMVERLEARTRAAFEDDPTATHLDYVELWQASGNTLTKLAEELTAEASKPDGTDAGETDTGEAQSDDSLTGPELVISGEMLTRYLDKTFGADMTETRLSRARARGAHRMSDRTLSIADGVKNKDDVPAARLQVSARQWVASQWNPAEFGRDKGGGVTVNICQLHLDALRAANVQRDRPRLVSDTEGS